MPFQPRTQQQREKNQLATTTTNKKKNQNKKPSIDEIKSICNLRLDATRHSVVCLQTLLQLHKISKQSTNRASEQTNEREQKILI